MTMKKFMNNPANLVRELLEGFCAAFPRHVELAAEGIVTRANPREPDKVAIVTLGGAGHEPALSGFVGPGLLDASVVGDIFAAPGPLKVVDGLRLLSRDAGILLVVLNHPGDVLSADIAVQMAQKENIKVKVLLTHEDIAPGADAPAEDRRGLVGCLSVIKAAGAAAEEGRSLEEVYQVASRLNDNMATLAVAMKPATHPQSGHEIFTLADDEMEIGMGQHGEAGTGRSKLLSADATAEVMLDRLLAAVKGRSGDRLLVMLNGAGATTQMELFIIFRKVAKLANERDMTIAHAMVGEYLTVQEMAGFQMCIAKLDDELCDLLKAPSNAPYWVTP